MNSVNNNIFKKIYYIIGEEDKKKIPWILGLFLLSAALDVLGLSLIGPYVSLLSSQNIENTGVIYSVISYFGFSTEVTVLMQIIGVVILGVFFIKFVSAIVVQWIIVKFGYDNLSKLRCKLMKSYQFLDYSSYTARNSAEYVYAIQNLTAIFSGKVLMTGLKVISDLIIGMAIILLLVWIAPLVMLALLVFLMVVVLLYDRIIKSNISHFGEKVNSTSVNIGKAINEGIEGLKEIRVLGKEKHFYNILQDNADIYSYNITRSDLYNVIPRYLIEISMISFVVLLSIFHLKLGMTTQEIIPVLTIFGVASLRIIPSFNSLSNGLLQLRYNQNTVSLLYDDIFLLESSNKGGVYNIENSPPSEQFESVLLDGISYSYPLTNKIVLDNINLIINKGESVGLIGSSGSGKSTLVDLMLGLLNPVEGRIIYNNKEIKNSLLKIRDQVAYLPQKVFLIDNSLKNNIALGVDDDKIQEEKIYSSIKQARLQSVVDQLPDGIETNIGESGIRLSGGQRQRIALARAFYHGRSVLVMDEATSALDNETEREIVDEIKNLKGDVTTIVIAHRYTTLKYCDRIYRLENGKIVQQGAYEDIVNISS